VVVPVGNGFGLARVFAGVLYHGIAIEDGLQAGCNSIISILLRGQMRYHSIEDLPYVFEAKFGDPK
jgi:hypothetical protein